MRNKMKAVVTGGAGFIGSHIVDALIDEGHEVVCIDNESSTANERFYWNPRCIEVVEDICDYKAILPYFSGVDIVFHLAAESRIQPAIENPTLAARTNMAGTCNVLQAARHSGASRVIYSSTSSAYGLENKIPQKEDMPTDCLNPYSVTKIAGEELCKMYNKLFGLNTVIFRYFNVYGERQPIKGQYAPVVGIFQRQVANKEPMTIVGDGLQRRDFTHVSDVVRANILAANSDNCDIFGEVINIGTGTNINMIELASMINDNWGTIHIPARLGEARETLADIKKARKLLNWQPKVKLEDDQ
jgi:UDP-glucose 4-epimerase